MIASRPQLFFYNETTSKWVEIEINDKTSFSFNYSVQDAEEPTAVDVGWSYAISIPKTATNNDYFSCIGEYSAILLNFSALKRTQFILYINSTVFESGYFALEEITKTEYKVRLYGGLGDFFYELQECKLKELDYGDKINISLNRTYVNYLMTTLYTSVDYISSFVYTDILTFFLSYQGTYDAFDSDHVIKSGPRQEDAIWQLHEKGLEYTKSEMNENQYSLYNNNIQLFGEYVSYYQKVGMRVAFILYKIQEFAASKGWTLTFNKDFFNAQNAFYNDLWCCLGNLPVSEPAADFTLSLDDVFAYKGVTAENNLNWHGSAIERQNSNSYLQGQNYHACRYYRWIDGIDEECLCNIGSAYENATNDLEWTVSDMNKDDSILYGDDFGNETDQDTTGACSHACQYWVDLSSYISEFSEREDLSETITVSLYFPFFLRALNAHDEFGYHGTVILNGDNVVWKEVGYLPTLLGVMIGNENNYGEIGNRVRLYNNETLDPVDNVTDYVITNMEIFDYNGKTGGEGDNSAAMTRHGFFYQIYSSDRYSTQQKRSYYDPNYKEDYLFEIKGSLTISRTLLKEGLKICFWLNSPLNEWTGSSKLNWMYRDTSQDNNFQLVVPTIRPVKGGYIEFFSNGDNVRSGTTLNQSHLFFNNDYNCLDFLLSYAKTFNLRFVKDATKKEVELMSHASYYSKFDFKDAEDLNDKICINKDVSITPTLVDYQKGVIGLQNTESELEKSYEEKTERHYGSIYLETGYEIDSNEKEYLSDVIFKTFINRQDYNESFLGRADVVYQDNKQLPYLQDSGGKAVDALFMLFFHNRANGAITLDDYFGLSDDDDYMYDVGFSYGVTNLNIVSRYTPALNSIKNNNKNFSLYFSTPDIRYNSLENYSGSIYERCWRNYLTDQLNKNTKSLTCYIIFNSTLNINDLFRQYYKIGTSLWILKEINNYDPENKSPAKCKFIQVQDPANYTTEWSDID